MRSRTILTFMFGLVLCAFLGCGKKGEEIAPVAGTVTYQGEPLAFCTVYFVPDVVPDPSNCITSAAKTDENGKFVLKTTELKPRDGAIVGSHHVSFRFLQFGGESLNEDEYADLSDIPNLPAGYLDGSKVTFEVPSGGTDSANFDLVD